jgi:hypothetical protein
MTSSFRMFAPKKLQTANSAYLERNKPARDCHIPKNNDSNRDGQQSVDKLFDQVLLGLPKLFYSGVHPLRIIEALNRYYAASLIGSQARLRGTAESAVSATWAAIALGAGASTRSMPSNSLIRVFAL